MTGAVVSDSELERIRLLLVDLVDLGAGGGVTDHGLLTGLADNDHPQYQLLTGKGAANGYAGLGAGGFVPVAQLGSGSPTAGKYLAGDGSWQTTPIVISAHSGLSGLSADDHTQYLLVDGTRAMSGNLRAPTISVGGAPLTGPLLSIPVAATASANYGEISIGAGPFDGSTSGFFAGNTNGTHIAINAGSGYLGRMIDAQIAGVRMFGVGRGSQASAVGATLNAIDLPSFTVTVTGSTAIATAAGFNYTRMGIPTYSAASALAITNAATLAIEGAPTGAGAGPATITNAYALWVQAGATRLDGTLQFSTDNTVARLAAASLRLGAAPSAAPTGYTLQIGESARGGTDTNTAGASATITSGIGTGTGTASSILFQTPTVGSTGSVAQTLATRLTVATAGITATVPVTIPAGAVNAPGLTFAGAPTIGLYMRNTSHLNITINQNLLDFTTNTIQMINTAVFGWGSGDPSGTSLDTILARDAANVLAQRNGTTAQAFRIYNTYTDASNHEYGTLLWTSNELFIGTVKAGTGLARDVSLYTQGASLINFYTNNTKRWSVDTSGHLAAAANLNLWNGTSALATNATAGFLGHPSSAGAPTGIPGSVPTGQVPCEVDTSNGRVYFYYGGAWHFAALT